MIRDDRAVSSAVGYTITLAIALTLMSGLIVAGSDMVNSQRMETTEAQLATVAEGLAGSLQTADRMVESGAAPGSLELRRDFPTQVAGSSYAIKVESDEVLVRVQSEDIRRTVPIDTATTVAGTSGWIQGGPVVIERNGAGNLEVTRA